MSQQLVIGRRQHLRHEREHLGNPTSDKCILLEVGPAARMDGSRYREPRKVAWRYCCKNLAWLVDGIFLTSLGMALNSSNYAIGGPNPDDAPTSVLPGPNPLFFLDAAH